MPKTHQALPLNRKTLAGILAPTGPIKILLKIPPNQPSPRTAQARVPKRTSRTEVEVRIPAGVVRQSTRLRAIPKVIPKKTRVKKMPKTHQALPQNKKTLAGVLVGIGPIKTLLKIPLNQPSPRTARARAPKRTSRTEGEVGIPASRIAGMPLERNCTCASTTGFLGSTIPTSSGGYYLVR